MTKETVHSLICNILNGPIKLIGNLILVVLMCTLMGETQGQCRLDTNVVINKTDTIKIPINIAGILNNDLNNTSQGVCRVNMAFEHVYIGDLLIWLISPSGQSVQLVGGEVMSGFTFGQTWDVSFVRDIDMAIPDPGFLPKWSNNQNWSVGGVGGYSGSYYPFLGSLENFNMGPVNGSWTLQIEDRSRFYGGKISGVQLVFCDDVGAECSPCEPHEIEILSSGFNACFGDSSLIFDVNLNITSSNDTMRTYGDTMILIHEDSILTYWAQNPFDLTDFPPGEYQICGLSYLKQHRSLLPDLGLQGWANWSDSLQAGMQNICAGLSTSCLVVNIGSIPDTVFIKDTFCIGSLYYWNDTIISSRGRYLSHFKSLRSACDSVVVLDLVDTDIKSIIALPDTLSCTSDSILLDGSISLRTINTKWQWQSENGLVLSSNTPLQQVNAAGVYMLILREGACRDTGFITVNQDTTLPSFTIETDTLSCLKDTVCLKAVGANAYSYLWVYSNDTISVLNNTCVVDTGIYKLSVAAANGCITRRTVVVKGDFEISLPIVKLDSLTCVNDTAWIVLENATDYMSFFWEDSSGNIINAERFYLLNAQNINLNLTAVNGCSKVFEFKLKDVRKPLIVGLDVDTISCLQQSVVPIVSSNVEITQYQWSNNRGFASSNESPKLIFGGPYELQVEDVFGCTWDTLFNVVVDTVKPEIEFHSDTITCIKNYASIHLVGDSSNVGFNWVGENGFESELPTPDITGAGRYFVVMASANGCRSLDTIIIVADTLLPNITLQSTQDNFNCNGQDSIFIAATTQLANAELQWSDSRGNVVDANALFVTQPGWYYIKVTGSKDCIATDSLYIGLDTIPPVFEMSGEDVLDCDRPARTWKITSGDPEWNYQVIHNGNTKAFSDSILINEPGKYSIIATGKNFCSTTKNIDIKADTTAPVIRTTDDTLNCYKTVVPLTFEAILNVDSFVWRDEGMNEIGVDSIRLPGKYTVTAWGRNGCFVQADKRVYLDDEIPVFSVISGNLDCRNITTDLIASVQGVIDQTYWEYQGVIIANSSSVNITEPGDYTFTVTGVNGCVHDSLVTVRLDTVKPIYDIVLLDSLNCKISTADINLSFGDMIPTYFRMEWTTADGEIEGSNRAKRITVVSEGTYLVKVLDENNGCSTLKSIRVKGDYTAPKGVEMEVIGPSCRDKEDGQISVVEVQGGRAPFDYKLNDGDYERDSVWSTLASGNYTIEIQGQNGCKYDTAVSLLAPPQWWVDAGVDRQIYLGESVNLDVSTNIPTGEIDEIIWTNSNSLSCDDCLQAVATPTNTTIYKIQAWTKSGCLVEGEVTIQVINGVRIYAPNSFSPNGDGINDHFVIYYAPESLITVNGQIFNRWGENVGRIQDVQSMGEISMWDGRFRGVPSPAGVYVYWLELALPNGQIVLKKDQVTLIR